MTAQIAQAASNGPIPVTMVLVSGGTPAWVTALAAPGGDLPAVAADFANDRYWIAGVGEVGIGDVFLNQADDTPFAPGLEPEGYQQLGDGLQGGVGDIYLSPAAQTAAALVGTFILGINVTDDFGPVFFTTIDLQDGSQDTILEWDFSNDPNAPWPNSIRDISGDQPDVSLTNLDALTAGPAKIGGTYSLTAISGSINGEVAVPLADLPAAYGDRAHMVLALIYGTWYNLFAAYPPQTDAHLATMTGV